MWNKQRVSRGAAWLDVVKPGWRDIVNVKALQMWSISSCVLGQVFAEEGWRLGVSGLSYALTRFRIESKDLGFWPSLGRPGLRRAWVNEIRSTDIGPVRREVEFEPVETPAEEPVIHEPAAPTPEREPVLVP